MQTMGSMIEEARRGAEKAAKGSTALLSTPALGALMADEIHTQS